MMVYCERCHNWVEFSQQQLDVLADHFGEQVTMGQMSVEDANALVHHATPIAEPPCRPRHG